MGTTTGARPRFSVSEFTTWHLSFEEDVALYKRLGVDGIEVCERKLSTDAGRAREQLLMLRESGLTVTSVQPRVHALFTDSMCPDLADPVERMGRFRKTIDLFGEVFAGQNVPLVTIGGKAPGDDFRKAHATARALYPPLARYAADRGIRVMFEPLNPVLMNVDTFICNLDDGLELIDAVDDPNFGLMLDVWHVWRQANVLQCIKDAGSRIFAVHVSDWPRDGVRSAGDRLLPGHGIIDLPRLLGAIEAAGYDGAYCLEIFSVDALPDSLWQRGPAWVVEEARRGFLKAWEARRCD